MEYFDVYLCNLEKLQKQIEKSNGLAAKLGCKPTTIVESEHFFDTHPRNELRKIEMVRVGVDIGEQPKLNGWQFQATLVNGAWFGDANGVVVKCAPDVTVERKWFDADPTYCDHCKMTRRRKDTFLVKQVETNEVKQVGRHCLKDFLGHNSPGDFIKHAEFLADLVGLLNEGPEWGGDKLPELIGREHYLSMACAMVKDGGYVSRKVADEHGCETTANAAWWMIVNPPQREEHRVAPTEDDRRRACKISKWVDGWLQNPDSDYMLNVQAAWTTAVVSRRTKGLLASVVAAYQRETGEALRKQQQAAEPSEHIGEAGERLTCERVVLIGEFVWDSSWGTTHCYKFMAGKDVIVWKSSKDKDLELGNEYSLKGTIKKLDEYRGEKQTVVTRCHVDSAV